MGWFSLDFRIELLRMSILNFLYALPHVLEHTVLKSVHFTDSG